MRLAATRVCSCTPSSLAAVGISLLVSVSSRLVPLGLRSLASPASSLISFLFFLARSSYAPRASLARLSGVLSPCRRSAPRRRPRPLDVRALGGLDVGVLVQCRFA